MFDRLSLQLTIMELNLMVMVLGVYAGLVTQGMVRRVVRLSVQPLQDLLKLGVLAMVTSLICCLPVALVIVAVAAFCLYSSLPSPYLPTEGKAVFITGNAAHTPGNPVSCFPPPSTCRLRARPFSSQVIHTR